MTMPALPSIATKGKHHASATETAPTFNTAENRRVLRKGKLPLLRARKILDTLSKDFARKGFDLARLETDGTTVFAVVTRPFYEMVIRADEEGTPFLSTERREERLMQLL